MQAIGDIRARLPFPLRGIDSDPGAELVHHQMKRHGDASQPKILFTRSRAYQKNDPAHIEQTNFTQVRLWFGYERCDAPEVWLLVDALYRRPLDRLLNDCLPTLKPEGQQRAGSKVVRQRGPAQTPLAWVQGCAEVSDATRARLWAERAGLNAFGLRREVDRGLQEIEAERWGTAP